MTLLISGKYRAIIFQTEQGVGIVAETKGKKFVGNSAQLMSEWDLEKNSALGFSPNLISCGSHRNVWWLCPKGHSYQMPVTKKAVRNFGCPICSGHKTISGVNDFATCYPALAKEWHPTKNGNLKPSDLSRKNGRKVW